MSTTRPEPISLTDLADPIYPPAAQALRAALAAYGATLELSPAPLMAAATGRTGLTRWGDPGFRERLAVLCVALTDEAQLSAPGVAVVFEQLVGNLVNRLRLEALIDEHPEIESITIDRPIVICGLPRSGTTHLHNLIAADPNIRSLSYWESLEPFPASDDHDEQGRRERCSVGLDLLDATMPEFKRMHEMTVDHAHEEIQLLANDISGMLFETTYRVPSFAAHYRSQNQLGSYRYLKRSLQALQWLRGGTRWVLKSPQHLEQFEAMFAAFGDATFVVTHRDPVQVTQSMITMVAYGSRMACDHPDPAAIGRYWLGRVENLLNGCVRDRAVLPAEQSIDVRFDEFMADEEATLRAIYAVADQPYDDGVRAAMAAFSVAHPRGRHGGIIYDLADIGLDPGEVARRLGTYRDRFVPADLPPQDG